MEKNIVLTFDFLREVVKNPKIINDIPNGATIDFIQKDIPIVENTRKKADKYFKVKHQFERVRN